MKKLVLLLALVLSPLLCFSQEEPDIVDGYSYMPSYDESGHNVYFIWDPSFYDEVIDIPVDEYLRDDNNDIIEIREYDNLFIYLRFDYETLEVRNSVIVEF